MSYPPGSLELRVLAGAPWLRYSQPAWLSNGVFQADLLGSNVAEVVIEATTDFAVWLPVATNAAFTGSHRFADPPAGVVPTRCYRARVWP